MLAIISKQAIIWSAFFHCWAFDFISVNDGYDSGMQAGNDVRGLEVAIKNIINASYSRDLSAKIAAADHVMQKKECISEDTARLIPVGPERLS